jgi:hypothetical protein
VFTPCRLLSRGMLAPPPMRIVQAVWPAILLTGYGCALAVQPEWSYALPFFLCFAWCVCACLLNPARRWSWWVCLMPVALCAIAGLTCFGSIAHMALFPDQEYWANGNQPGAIALIGGLFFLLPSSLLLWHLLSIRRRFYDTANASALRLDRVGVAE